MEIDEEYLTFCLEFKLKMNELVNSDWYKENHNDPIWAESTLDMWYDHDYLVLRSLAIASDAPDWKDYFQRLEVNHINYHKMRERMRRERNEQEKSS